MSWANCGEDDMGRPIGYAHSAICDEGDCKEGIDRGLSYVCGGMHGGETHSCGKYFCERHRHLVDTDIGLMQLCNQCKIDYYKEMMC